MRARVMWSDIPPKDTDIRFGPKPDRFWADPCRRFTQPDERGVTWRCALPAHHPGVCISVPEEAPATRFESAVLWLGTIACVSVIVGISAHVFGALWWRP